MRRAGAGRALRVVLVRRGDAEEGGDPVTHVGVNGPAELLDGAAHAADALADDHLHLGGREALAEARGADDVREQGRHGAQLVLGAGRGGRALVHARLRGRGHDRGRGRRGFRLLGGARGVAGHRQDRPPFLDRIGHHLHRARSDRDDIAGGEPFRPHDALSVHPGAVERPEILDLDRIVGRAYESMASRDERILDGDIRVQAPDHELGLDRESTPSQRAVLDHERRHEVSLEARSTALCHPSGGASRRRPVRPLYGPVDGR